MFLLMNAKILPNLYRKAFLSGPMQMIYAIVLSFMQQLGIKPIADWKYLTISILKTPKQVLLQTVKTLMKCHIIKIFTVC